MGSCLRGLVSNLICDAFVAPPDWKLYGDFSYQVKDKTWDPLKAYFVLEYYMGYCLPHLTPLSSIELIAKGINSPGI